MQTNDIASVVPITLWSVMQGGRETRCIVDRVATLGDVAGKGGMAAVAVDGEPVYRQAFSDTADLIRVTSDWQLVLVPTPVERT